MRDSNYGINVKDLCILKYENIKGKILEFDRAKTGSTKITVEPIRVVRYAPHFIGGMTGILVDVRLILSVWPKIAASYIMKAHHHPFGNLQPSKQDIELSNK